MTAKPACTWVQDPGDNRDRLFDWAEVLADAGGTTISTMTVTATSGLTVGTPTATNADTAVRVRVSGGSDGSSYRLTCQIVCADGQQFERYATVKVRDR